MPRRPPFSGATGQEAASVRDDCWRTSALAGQLVAEGGQGLVGGQGAGRGVVVRACGAVAAAARAAGGRLGGRGGVARLALFLGLGAGFLDLATVCLEAGAGLGVLPLPLLALGLVAGEPVAALRVEAFGVQVVALVVVGRGHAVERRVELVARHLAGHTLVGLLERQADPPPVQVDVDDLYEDLLAHLNDLLRDLHVPVGQLGDVHQALDALLDADERAERDQLGDPAGNDLADLVRAGELLPRVFLRGLQRQRDALAVHVHVEDLDRDLLADLDNLTRVVDVLPGQLGHVHEAVHAAEVDERAEVDDRRDDALADLALAQRVEERVTHLGLGLLEPGTAGQDHVVAVLVQLDDLGFDFLADVRCQVAHAAHLDQRCRQETAQADVEDETTLDHLDDGAGDDAVLFLDLFDVAPGTLVLSALLGQDQAAFLVLLGEDQGFDVVADGNDVTGVDVVLDGK